MAPKMDQKVVIGHDIQNKISLKLNFRLFWPIKIYFGMKTNDLGWESHLTLPCPECVVPEEGTDWKYHDLSKIASLLQQTKLKEMLKYIQMLSQAVLLTNPNLVHS